MAADVTDAPVAEPIPDPPPAARGGPGEPRHRLRALPTPARVLAVVAAVLLLVPVGASLLRAVDQGWVPSNDEALIVLRSFDVLGQDRPLVGQPSTAGQYAADHPARHPGPIEFYLLAVPVRVLGPTWGTLLTVALITGAAVLLTAWAAFRRAGPVVGLGAVALVAAVMWSTGTAVLTDPISSNVGGYPLLAGCALAWALWGDDRRLWPVAVAVWSFATQQHLAVLGPTGVVAAWGVLGAVVTTVRARHQVGRLASALRWGAASVAIGFVCWLPPLVDQLFGDGNLAYILGFSGSEDRDTLGLVPGLRAVGRALGWPPWLVQRDRDGGHLIDPYVDTATAIGAVVGLVLLVACGALAATTLVRHRRAAASTEPADGPSTGGALDAVADGAAARLTLALTGLVVAAAGVVTTANVPASVEQIRINFYRWTWPVAVILWGSVAWAVGVALVAWRARRAAPAGEPAPVGVRPRPAWAAAVPVVVLALVAVVVGATATGEGRHDRRRDELIFAFEAEAADAVLDVIDHDRPVHLATRGSAAFLALSPSLAVALEDAGVDVRLESTEDEDVDTAQRDGYGPHRLELADDPGARVHVLTGTGELPEVPGTTVARFALGVRADRVARELVAQLESGPIVPSDRAEELLAGYRPEVRELLAVAMTFLEADPMAGVYNENVIELLQAGYLESPELDPDLLDAMADELDRGLQVWGDDRFAVVVELLP
jgi:hypothetical protein